MTVPSKLLLVLAATVLTSVSPVNGQARTPPAKWGPLPAVNWSCSVFEETGRKFQLSGHLDEALSIDPQQTFAARIDSDGSKRFVGAHRANYLMGHGYTIFPASDSKTEYFHINLKWRKVGWTGSVRIERFDKTDPAQRVDISAVGFCNSTPDKAAKK